MIDVMQPKSGEKIIDPACGSGGFLAYILRHLLLTNNNSHFIAGIDKDLFLSRLAKIYLTLLDESEYHIFCENSLEQPEKWNKKTSDLIQLGSFDLILTNPPFGAKIPVIGNDLLRQYELGHYWNNNKGVWLLTNQLRDKQPPQILFIERIIQLLKDGGRAGIVLPEGIFGNPSDRYIWEYIRKYASIIGVVSLSQETFQPSTHTKTSVVFLEKRIRSRNNVFFAIAKAIGHNKNGKETYKMNEGGQCLLDKNGNKILDDETPDIAKSFNRYLNGKLEEESHLGFVVPIDEINENIYIPESYKPEIKEKLNIIKKTNKYSLVKFGDV
jgi:type I restriction enzyme M protein